MENAPPDPPDRYTVAVRTLCDFTARAGDLDLRFTPSPTAQEGIASHAAVAARRPAPYESEITLSGEWQQLRVRGRADGYDPRTNRLEEVKTHRGDLQRQPAHHRHLHWAQAEVYGWLMCAERGLASIELALVYYDIGDGAETVLLRQHTADELRQRFEARCALFQHWARQEMAHRAARDAALAGMTFPHADFRAGQRPLAEAVYRAQRSGRCLMAQAPTGIGKTVATLFPALKACPPAGADKPGLDRVFFLTARTSGRRIALDSLRMLRRHTPALPLRVLEMVARDKACEHPDKACHGDACPLARGFYDRLPAARAEAVQLAGRGSALDKPALREVALAHGICPYYLGQELTRWSDVAVGDVNHWFDGSALLFALATDAQWRCGLLVDEAHNLVERGRAMYSASLDPVRFREARRAAPAAVRRPLDRLHRAWKALVPASEAGTAAGRPGDFAPRHEFAEVPPAFQRALQDAATALGEHLAEQPPTADGALLQQFWFEALRFARRIESFGDHSLFDATRLPGRAGLQLDIRNLVPAPFLAPRFAAARATTLFSATLRPQAYHQDMLGLPGDTVCIDVPSPYAAHQLQVRVARHISTRWQHRESSLGAVADVMARQFAEAPGNYLAFFSSFDYLQRAADLLRRRHPEIPLWEQSRGMDETARDAFLQRFAPAGRGIGFAVLGGVFGEGIDLPGDRLIGAFIATLGLPQLNPVNERLRERLDQRFGSGAGYDYAYLFPGLQKVVQAAGRVIRSASDQGCVWLMDDRFARPATRRLLPDWWHVEPALAVD
ncbi:ATP-dependent DNA helicase [Xylophilus sp. Kf1]|nr:ATP-dependent DNA helicase [Xylophilus sp. Kf1]